MANVLILRKRLKGRPQFVNADIEINVRRYADGDAGHWLRLRAASLPASPAGRPWVDDDFAREFLSQSWWSPDRMLFSITGSDRVVGTVTLGERGSLADRGTSDSSGDQGRATIHWLLVDPEFRRHGVATCLVSRLEQMCWDHGWRSISLETLSSWTAAVAFYEARGYASVDKDNGKD